MNASFKESTVLKGQVALVTGGASGIDRAVALALAREGAQVVMSDIDPDGGYLAR